MTLQDLITFAENTKTAYEIHYPLSSIRSSIEYRFTVGIELENDIWYWFTSYDYEVFNKQTFIHEITKNVNDIELNFSHRYNRNNGATVKSIRQEIKAEKMILSTKKP